MSSYVAVVDASVLINLGFTFTFYGHAYTQAFISSRDSFEKGSITSRHPSPADHKRVEP